MKVTSHMANNQVIMQAGNKEIFQSYDSIIAIRENGKILFSNHWDYSRTTMKYLGQFLNSNGKEIRAKFKSGEYKVSIDTDGNDL